MSLESWLVLFSRPVDAIGFALFVLLFPFYHAIYPRLMRAFPNHAAKVRMDRLRRSWIQGLIERRDVIAAAQQTRNLTMVNSLLASSALILMGVSSNILVRLPEVSAEIPHSPEAGGASDAMAVKLLLLIAVFGVAFAYCMTSLRHLGHFNLVIGADPAVVEELEGSSVDYFSALINRASSRYTLAVRTLYSASAIFLWLFDPWWFIAVTVFWGVKFIVFQDFASLLRQRRVTG